MVETGVEQVKEKMTKAESVIALERECVLGNYSRYPMVLERGKGCYLYDTDGRRYLDLISGIGVNALGHAHPRVVRVIREQSTRLIHCSNLYYHEYQGKLAKKLVDASGLDRVFFCNSGAEAVEGAVKIMRSHGNSVGEGKLEMVSLNNSFHGRTMGALALTGQPKYQNDFRPMLEGVRFIDANNLEQLESVVNDKTAGIIIEGIQGEGGIHPMTAPFLEKARQLADRHNALLIFDAIQCGVGRTGHYFSHQAIAPHVKPDVMVTAKPLSCGLPLGVVMVNERAAAAIRPGMHGTTFGGGALTTRVALEFMEILADLLPQINRVGEYFRQELRELGRKHSFVQEVRGLGLMIGVQLAIPGKDMVLEGMKHGLLFNCTHDTTLRFLPPYILTEKEVDKAISGLRKVFRSVK